MSVFIFPKNCIIGSVIPCFFERWKNNLQKNVFSFGGNYRILYICSIQTNKKQIMTTQMTIREIRQELFSTEKYTVIGSEEMTNKESRDFLYEKENQDDKMNVIDNDTHFLIWK